MGKRGPFFLAPTKHSNVSKREKSPPSFSRSASLFFLTFCAHRFLEISGGRGSQTLFFLCWACRKLQMKAKVARWLEKKPAFSCACSRNAVPLTEPQEAQTKVCEMGDTVDGRNPVPVDRVNVPLFTGFHTPQVVQDWFHQQYSMVDEQNQAR